MGKIIEKLEALNISKNTLVVFLGDNGPNGNRWNDSLKGIKGSTDEGGVKSSLIMYLPGKIKKAKMIICTDGSANKLLKINIEPDIIIGDMDSLESKSIKDKEIINRRMDETFLSVA